MTLGENSSVVGWQIPYFRLLFIAVQDGSQKGRYREDGEGETAIYNAFVLATLMHQNSEGQNTFFAI